MSNSTEKRREAVKWLIELQEAQEPAPSRVEAWEQWIADPEREASFDRVIDLWERTGTVALPVPDAEELAADDYDGSKSIAEWSARRAVNPPRQVERAGASIHHVEVAVVPPSTSKPWRWQRQLAVAGAAAIVLIAWMGYSRLQATLSEPQLYETHLAEHRAIELEDGSQILLGARTSLWVTYTRQQRIVVLDRGVALFDVARDPQRPFVVHAGQGSATAIGTSFSVQRDQERVEVTVAEGVVRVEPRSSAAGKPAAAAEERPVIATLARGQQVRYGGGNGEISIVRVDPDLAMAWRDGRLQYIDEPLRNVVSDVNRYTKRQIVLNGPQAQALRFTGLVFQADADRWVDQLPDVFPALEIIDASAGHIVLRVR